MSDFLGVGELQTIRDVLNGSKKTSKRDPGSVVSSMLTCR
jgi:hypothetical protein